MNERRPSTFRTGFLRSLASLLGAAVATGEKPSDRAPLLEGQHERPPRLGKHTGGRRGPRAGWRRGSRKRRRQIAHESRRRNRL